MLASGRRVTTRRSTTRLKSFQAGLQPPQDDVDIAAVEQVVADVGDQCGGGQGGALLQVFPQSALENSRQGASQHGTGRAVRPAVADGRQDVQGCAPRLAGGGNDGGEPERDVAGPQHHDASSRVRGGSRWLRGPLPRTTSGTAARDLLQGHVVRGGQGGEQQRHEPVVADTSSRPAATTMPVMIDSLRHRTRPCQASFISSNSRATCPPSSGSTGSRLTRPQKILKNSE